MRETLSKSTVFMSIMTLAFFSAPLQAVEAKEAVATTLIAGPSAIFVGTPVAAARCSLRSVKSIYHEYDNDPLCWKILGRPCALPIGLVEGAVKGLIAGPRNAFRYAGSRPFSRDSFSLEKLD